MVKERRMYRTELLEKAADITTHDRNNDYGEAKESFGRIASMWSAYLGQPVSEADVCAMMVLLKVSRSRTSPQKMDNWIDQCGYAALAGEMVSGG
jgi:hypothetical protein